MPYKDPEKAREQKRIWYLNNKNTMIDFRKTEEGTKINRITNWKQKGIICKDWDELYDYYMLTSNCEYCNVELINGYVGINRKCLDHNHETGEVRGIICHKCNSLDVFKNC